jgi:Ca2+-binding RTX toxin-like protein
VVIYVVATMTKPIARGILARRRGIRLSADRGRSLRMGSPRRLIGLLTATAALALPATASATAQVEVLTGTSEGVVRVQYSTAINIGITFEPNGSGTADDMVGVFSLSTTSPSDLSAGPGCTEVKANLEVQCDGQISGNKFRVLDQVTVTFGLGGTGSTNDIVKLFDVQPFPGIPDIDTGPGNDTVDLSRTLTDAGISSFWRIDTASGDDRITTSTLADQVIAGDGNDYIVVTDPRSVSHPDTISGGNGTDTLDFSTRGLGVIVDLPNRQIGGTTTNDGTIPNRDVENVIGTNFDDTIIGSSGNNTLIGLAGSDHITGGDGNDGLAAFADVVPPSERRTSSGLAPPTSTFVDDDVDDLRGGDGTDTLNVGGDGLNDTAECGANPASRTNVFGQFTLDFGDTVYADLVDHPRDCEHVVQQDLNERGMVVPTVLGKGIGDDGEVRVRLRCPKEALTNCVGFAGLGVGKPEVARHDRVRYSVRRGHTETTTVELPDRKIGKRSKVYLVCEEMGKENPRVRSILLNP